MLEQFSDGATVRIDFTDVDKGVDQIATYASRYPLRAIVGTDEVTTVLAATSAAALDLPHNAPEAVRLTVDKHAFRRCLAEAGLPGPSFRLVARADDPADIAGTLAYPCVLKPLSLSGSRGVIRANDPAGFVIAFRRIGQILDDPGTAAPQEMRQHILIENYVPGTEVALEGLLQNGTLRVLALFDKPDPLEGPFFEETIYVTPSRLPDTGQRAIVGATGAAVEALGLREGPVHAELRVDPAGPVVIELAARSIGGLCARTLRFGVGVSLEELILRHAMSQPIASLAREPAPAGVMMLPIPRAGRLRHVEGKEAATAVEGIEDIAITVPLGQELVPLPEGDRYLGFLFARAETPAAVESALRHAHALLRFEIAP